MEYEFEEYEGFNNDESDEHNIDIDASANSIVASINLIRELHQNESKEQTDVDKAKVFKKGE